MEDNNNDYNVLWVDTRNAMTDHRTGAGSRPVPFMPGNRIPAGWNRGPMNYPQPQVVYANPPVATTFASTLFGKLTTGQVVEMVAQLFAALQPLPSAPAVTKDASIDSGNLILFQSALASHAKRDEQVRTLGGLVAKLVG